MWICVSDAFALENIFQMMLGGKHGFIIEQLPGEVRKKIEGKRYLLVLDDVWNETRHEWDDLKSILNLGGKGSRVVVTSRSKKVASVVGDDLMYELQGLSDEVSWNLFKRLAFNQGKEPVNSKDHFFDVGKEIVKKCANVPLLIKVIGSMLYDQDYSFWQSLRSANLLETGQDQHCLHRDVLKYSYYHLTPALKSCFSFCALFPKDFKIEKKLLIRLWLAQGCLENSHDCRSEEDVGKLRDLRALVNLRNELTIKFNDNFRCDAAEYEEVELLRLAPLKHLIIQFSDHGPAVHETLLGCFQPHGKLSAISITSYKGFKFPLWAESLASSLPQLVGIYLVDFDCLEILPSLSQLRHLKYLSLWRISKVEFMQSDGDVVPLDDQLVSFPCLEELELHDLPKLKGWWRKETNTMAGETCASSMVVRSFPRLRKLNLEQCPNLKVFPSCPKLISVKLRKCHEALTLVGSKTTTSSFVLYLEELIIDNSVTTLDCLFGESLGGIQQLSIHYFKGQYLPSLAAEAVVRLNIQRLEICSCGNLKSLSGFVEHLTNLQSLTIEYCENLELENNEEGVTVRPWKSLHLLSSLVLNSLHKLIKLPEALQDLTSLEHLEIVDCRNFESLPEWLNCLTLLQTLSIGGCCKLKSLPEAIAYMPSLKTLNLACSGDLKKRCSKPNGEDWPKICRIPRISLHWERFLEKLLSL